MTVPKIADHDGVPAFNSMRSRSWRAANSSRWRGWPQQAPCHLLWVLATPGPALTGRRRPGRVRKKQEKAGIYPPHPGICFTWKRNNIRRMASTVNR